jgi:hypothetical protein
MKTVIEGVDGITHRLGVRKYDAQVRIDGEVQTEEQWEGGCTCGFRTSGWPTRTLAEDRIEEHGHEHENGEDALTSELAAFKEATGYDTGVNTPPPTDPFTEEA